MNNTQVYQAQTTNHGIARALGQEIRMITDVEETTYNGHGEITVEYTNDVALTELFDRIKALYEKGESYETKPFLHFKVLEDDLEPKPGVFTAKEIMDFLGIWKTKKVTCWKFGDQGKRRNLEYRYFSILKL